MKRDWSYLARPLTLTAVLAALFVALHNGWLGAVTEKELLHRLFLYHWGVAWPVFVLVGIVYTALGGPRQVLAFSSGYLLGGWQGAILSTFVTGGGALATMMVSRHLAGDWLRERHPQRIHMLQRLLAQDAWLWMCVLRLLPVGSNLATNVAAGLSGLRLTPLLAGSLLGYLPQMLLFSYVGAGLALNSSTHLWISLGLLLASTALGVYLYQSGVKKRDESFSVDVEKP